MTKTANPPKGTKKSEKPAPKTEAKPPAKDAPKHEPKQIQPAPKVVVSIDAAGAEKIERLASMLGTIHARKQAAMANRESAFEDRDAIEEELVELGLEAREARTDEYLAKCADKIAVLDKIKALDVTIKACNNAYDRVAGECQQGTFRFAEVTVDELLTEATKKSRGQMTLADSREHKTVLPSYSFSVHAAEIPQAFPGVKIEDIEKMERSLPANARSPLLLAKYLARAFADKTYSTKDRRELLAGPEWWLSGVRAALIAAICAELCGGDEEGVMEAEAVERNLCECARLDIDAWIDIAGGKDSELNRMTVGKKTA